MNPLLMDVLFGDISLDVDVGETVSPPDKLDWPVTLGETKDLKLDLSSVTIATEDVTLASDTELEGVAVAEV